jgi:N-acetylglucosamine-6-phosphate deacetylase
MFNDQPVLKGIRTICEAHGALGSTGLLPTLITDTPEVTASAINAGISASKARVPGFLGLHLEGPHLDPKRKGAHEAALIRPMGDADLERLLGAAARLPVLMVTVAPANVTLEQISALSRAGVIVSLGHADASHDEARAAFAAGAASVTHLFNAMSPLGHHEPGLAGAALDSSEAWVGVIADGIHVAPETLRIALAGRRVPDRMLAVSDAMAVAGTLRKEFTLRGRKILRRDGRLTLADGTLAGADIDLAGSVRVLVDQVGLSLERALRMVTAAPAECIGSGGRLGCLKPGVAADFVHLDQGLHLRRVWRGGDLIA